MRRCFKLTTLPIAALACCFATYIEGMQTLEIVDAFTEKADGRRIPVNPDEIITQDAASGLLATYLRDLKQKIVILPKYRHTGAPKSLSR